MRISLRALFILVIFSGHALAAKPKKATAKHPAQTMDSNDPAEKELSEKKEEAALAPDSPEVADQKEKSEDAVQVRRLRERDKTVVYGNVLVGFGRAPEAGPGADVESGKTTSVTFMAGGHYDLSPELTIGARIPWTVGTATQTDGTDKGLNKTSQALGAAEILGEYRVTLSPFTRLPIFFGLGIPISAGDYDTTDSFRQARINEVADAASGYRDPELFGAKRLPVIVGLGIDYRRKAFDVHGATKFVFGVKVGGTFPVTDVPGVGTFELKSVSFRNVTSGGIGYQFLDKPNLFGALDGWIAYNAINQVEFISSQGASGPTRFQVAFEPRIGARFGKISPSVGYIFPIGGRLADSSASGLELHCDVAF